MKKLIALLIVAAFCAAPAAGATVWTEDFQAYTPLWGSIEVASGGIWNDAHEVSNYPRVSNEYWWVEGRPDGGGGGQWAGAGTTGGLITATRPLGTSYNSGILSISGWVASRSTDGNTDNKAGFGFHTSGTANEWPAIVTLSGWSTSTLSIHLDGIEMTFGDADGLAGRWNHVKLEYDLDANVVRLYKDADPVHPGLGWVQLGDDVDTGDLVISHAAIYHSRDGDTDDLVVDWVAVWPCCVANARTTKKALVDSLIENRQWVSRSQGYDKQSPPAITRRGARSPDREEIRMKTKFIALMLAVAFCVAPAAGTVLWTDDFESYLPPYTALELASGGIWNDAFPALYSRTTNEYWWPEGRPDGGGGAQWAGAGSSGGLITSTRPLGTSYDSGILSISAWVTSRSTDSNTDNMGGFGFHTSGTPNEWPALVALNRWSTSMIELHVVGGAFGTQGSAQFGAGRWNHVKLEYNLDNNVARIFKDIDSANPANDVWVQLGSDVATGDLVISHVAVYTSRDSGIDDIVVDYYAYPVLAGDVNNDHFVGGADITQIIQNWGMTPAERTDGDLSGNNVVDQADFDEVIANWGASASPLEPPAGATPEPASLALLLAGGFAMLGRRK